MCSHVDVHVVPMQVAPDEEYDWVVRYQSKIRLAPLLAGGIGILGVLANRVISGVSWYSPCLCAPRSVKTKH